MITQVENTEARRYFAGFMNQCQAYKDLLTAAGLPVSVDLDVLSASYRQQLFDGLLKVDKGLKARFDLLRTDEARAKLITDTINLDGHDVIDDAAKALQQLERTYQQVAIPDSGPLHRDMPLSSFADGYGLDFGQLLDANTLSWTGNEHVKAYFDNLAVALTPWLSIVRKTMKSGASVDDAGQLLGQFFTADSGGRADEPVRLNEKVLYHRMHSQKLDFHVPRS